MIPLAQAGMVARERGEFRLCNGCKRGLSFARLKRIGQMLPTNITFETGSHIEINSDEMQSKLPSRSLPVFFLRLGVVLVVFAVILVTRIALDWDGTARQAMLRNVENGVALGNRTAEAIGSYFLKQGRYPSGVDDLPVKIENTSMATVALSQQAGEVVITLVNKRFGIDGRRMYFKPEIGNGKVERIVCQTDDDEFRKRIDGRCG